MTFSGAVAREHRDLPWEQSVAGWQVDPDFHQVARRLLDGAAGAERDIAAWMTARAGPPPQGSRYSADQVLARLVQFATDAAAEAVEDHRHPAALAVQQRGLISSHIDEVSVDLAAAVQRVYTSVQDYRAEMAADTALLARSTARGPADARRAHR